MSDNRQWEKVADDGYFRAVMGKMVDLGFGPRRDEAGYVRFGITGIGHAPNYQIEGPDGVKHCFKGMGHGEAVDAGDEFAPSNLSADRFSYTDVRDMLARLTGTGVQ
ncbi:hypothetical protein [Sphingobium sp. HWE2-09]|uniref:hypothetical protein n=1 Tax=Sphingobium sp. HWE2-09 TaxID=3108390 RepID=UPI002DC224B6|nr:hypothetical protein [Sphingobium sp. HWE2-09]